MAWNDLARRAYGVGQAIRLEVSSDNFATVTFRLSDVAGKLDGTNDYEARIIDISSLQRGLGEDHIAASGSVTVTLDNTDGGLDAMANRANASVSIAYRFRLHVVLYETGSPATMYSKQVGEFGLSRWPTRTNDTIRVEMVDDIITRLSNGILPPSFSDFIGDDPDGFRGGTGQTFPETWFPSHSVQLCFGEGWHQALPIARNRDRSRDDFDDLLIPLFATKSTASHLSSDYELRTVLAEEESTPYTVPRTLPGDPDPLNSPTTVTVWQVERTPAFKTAWDPTGDDWYVVYIRIFGVEPSGNRLNGSSTVFRDSAAPPGDYSSLDAGRGGPARPRGAPDEVNRRDPRQVVWDAISGKPKRWWFRGFPLSSFRTGLSSSRERYAAEIIADIAEHYASPPVTVNTASLDRAIRTLPMSRATGTLFPYSEGNTAESVFSSPKPARAIITEICQSSDLDITINSAGELVFVTDYYDDATAAGAGNLPAIYEGEISSFEEWIPDETSRWSPLNVLLMDGGRPSEADGYPDPPFQGPFVMPLDREGNPLCEVSVKARTLLKVVQQGWRPYGQTVDTPWIYRRLNTRVRPMVRFTTTLSAAMLELGEYFRLFWTRGLAGPYNPAVFQVESIDLDFQNSVVTVQAVWQDDLQTDLYYLADDSTITSVTVAFSSGSVAVQDSISTATFSSFNPGASGVLAGDMLVLRGTGEADGEWKRNRAVRITGIASSSSVFISSPDGLDFGSGPSPVDIANWTIYRGQANYPTALVDAGNYPNGSTRYGKLSQLNGTFVNTTVANKLR